MPAPKTKAPTNGPAPKTKASKSTPASTGTSTPAPIPETSEQVTATSGSGKPDKTAYDAEQDKIKTEIDDLQAKLSILKDKISLTTKSGPGNDRRSVLRAELDSIRAQQSTNKTSRTRIFDQLKAIQENMQKKNKDLQTARSKIPFKSVADVDAHIKHLEKQVESGNLKLVDEKKALQEISQCKRSRRTVEGFQAELEGIEADRRAADELRKQLDDPESKAVSERYEAIKAELDELKRESDEAYAGRSKLFEERDILQAQLNTLFNSKRESAQNFRDANDRYWNKVNEDRARRAEKVRAERAASEAAKKLEVAERLREEASAPAYQAQIEDCQTLIDFFGGKHNAYAPLPSASLSTKTDVVGVPKLELRKLDAVADDGLVAMKKKGEEESYFVGGKGKKGKKGGSKAGTSEANGTSSSSGQLNVPLATLSALLSLSIPPPAASADVPRVVEDLKTKKAWFEANQSRVTAENVSKAEAEIMRLTGGKPDIYKADSGALTAGGIEHLGELASIVGFPKTAVSSGEVVEKLEAAQEQQ